MTSDPVFPPRFMVPPLDLTFSKPAPPSTPATWACDAPEGPSMIDRIAEIMRSDWIKIAREENRLIEEKIPKALEEGVGLMVTLIERTEVVDNMLHRMTYMHVDTHPDVPPLEIRRQTVPYRGEFS